MSKGLVLRASGLLVGAAACAACALVLGIEERPPYPGDAGDKIADLDAGDDGACLEDDIGARRPDGSTGAGPSSPVVFAFSKLDLGIVLEQRAGFDLDHATGASCVTEGAPDLEPNPVDSTAAQLISGLATFANNLSAVEINNRLVERDYGIAVTISEWNGTGDDSVVVVRISPALGVGDDQGNLYPPSTAPPDPGDLWIPDGRFDPLQDGVLLLSARAWIAGGKLVARFSDLTLPIRPSSVDPTPFDLVLHDAWITANVSTTALGDGLIAGRIAVADLVDQAKLLNGGDGYLCEGGNEQLRNLLVSVICKNRDIRVSHCDDGKSLPCDAVSFGARFDAYAVTRLGGPRRRTATEYYDAGYVPPEERCADAGAVFACPSK